MDSDDDIPCCLSAKDWLARIEILARQEEEKKGVKKEGRNGGADGYDSDDVPLISFVKKESKVKKAKKKRSRR